MHALCTLRTLLVDYSDGHVWQDWQVLASGHKQMAWTYSSCTQSVYNNHAACTSAIHHLFDNTHTGSGLFPVWPVFLPACLFASNSVSLLVYLTT